MSGEPMTARAENGSLNRERFRLVERYGDMTDRRAFDDLRQDRAAKPEKAKARGHDGRGREAAETPQAPNALPAAPRRRRLPSVVRHSENPSALRRFAATLCFMRFACVSAQLITSVPSLGAIDASTRLPVRRALNEFRAFVEQGEIVNCRRVARVDPQRCLELRPSLVQLSAQHIRISLVIENVRSGTDQFSRSRIAAIGKIEFPNRS